MSGLRKYICRTLAFMLTIMEVVFAGSLTSPEQFFGFKPGEENQLVDSAQLLDYFRLLDRESDRLLVQELGRTTENRPFWIALISSRQNLERRAELVSLQSILSDPASLAGARARRLMRDARVIVVIACAIHPREIGSTLMSTLLAYRLLSQETPETAAILSETVIILLPAHNPDGLDHVVNWWRDHRGTPYASGPMPYLDQLYTGHDLNRDWVLLSQKETRLTVEKIYSIWRPHLVFDIHQMQSLGARMFLPPYVDPYDVNIDPGLQAAMNAIGMQTAADMTQSGLPGVAVNVYYDAASPDRSFIPYHGGVRILGEIASARLAAPVDLSSADLKNDGDFSPTQSSWRQPLPWSGGSWGLRQIVDYGLAAAWSILTQAAREREAWLWSSYNALKRAASESDEKPTFVVPADQHDPFAVYQLVEILQRGGVKVFRALSPIVIGETRFPAGSYLIPTAQPYGGFARTLLESRPELLDVQHPYKPPYDMSSHHLGWALGITLTAATGGWRGEWRKCDPVEPRPDSPSREKPAPFGYVIDYRGTESVKVINRLLARKRVLFWIGDSLTVAGRPWPPGSIWVPEDSLDFLWAQAAEHPIRFDAAPDMHGRPLWNLQQPRIGLYASHLAEVDEGWTRFLLESYDFNFCRLFDADIRQGGLAEAYDVIILPSQPAERILNGAREGTMPPEYCGGLGQAGLQQLRAFVKQGGTLILLNQACSLGTGYFAAPLKNVIKDLPAEEFVAPGSFLRGLVDVNSPLGYGLPAETALFFHQGAAFETAGGETVVRFAGDHLLLDGQLRGEELLALRSAVVWVPQGRGALLFIGVRPQFRAKTAATFKLLFNGLYRSSARPYLHRDE